MAANVAFRAMYERIGFTNEGATILADTENIISMRALKRLKPEKVKLICKQMRSPGGANPGITVSAGAEINLTTAARVAHDWWRMSRPYGAANIDVEPSDLFDDADRQKELEGEWDNSQASFAAIADSELKDGGFIRILDEFDENLKLVRGCIDVPIAYMRRRQLIPPEHDDDGAENYSTRDAEMIARVPIVMPEHVGVEDLENASGRTRYSHANRDNAIVYAKAKLVFGKCAIWVHALPAVRTMDGRKAIRLMKDNMMGRNAMDVTKDKNIDKVRGLRYYGERRNTGWEHYVQQHKKCHAIQLQLHIDHGYADWPARDKVTYLLRGIACNGMQTMIDLIENTPRMRGDFNEAQLAVVQHIATKSARNREYDLRGIAGVATAGGRGPGGGRGGRMGRRGGRGRGPGGRDRGGWSQEGHGPKYPGGTWKKRAIISGQYDAHALKLTHIDKPHYSSAEFDALNCLERRKLKLNQEADRRGEPVPTPTKIRTAQAIAISNAEADGAKNTMTMISELNTTVSSLVSAVQAQKNELSDLKKVAKRAVDQEEVSQDEYDNRTNEALVRGGLKKQKSIDRKVPSLCVTTMCRCAHCVLSTCNHAPVALEP